MAKKGMNPDAVNALATAIIDNSKQAQTIYDTVYGELEGLDWTGEDRDRFLSDFESALGQAVTNLVSTAEGFGQRAQENAAAQVTASS